MAEDCPPCGQRAAGLSFVEWGQWLHWTVIQAQEPLYEIRVASVVEAGRDGAPDLVAVDLSLTGAGAGIIKGLVSVRPRPESSSWPLSQDEGWSRLLTDGTAVVRIGWGAVGGSQEAARAAAVARVQGRQLCHVRNWVLFPSFALRLDGTYVAMKQALIEAQMRGPEAVIADGGANPLLPTVVLGQTGAIRPPYRIPLAPLPAATADNHRSLASALAERHPALGPFQVFVVRILEPDARDGVDHLWSVESVVPKSADPPSAGSRVRISLSAALIALGRRPHWQYATTGTRALVMARMVPPVAEVPRLVTPDDFDGVLALVRPGPGRAEDLIRADYPRLAWQSDSDLRRICFAGHPAPMEDVPARGGDLLTSLQGVGEAASWETIKMMLGRPSEP